ncbi:MAG TPA: glycosyltransferase family 4 protein [Candidatus Woesebacteria bacterium]|nr:glycosyltransferase family 4 protein [Candidatus Woesebacteria bacterium]HNS94589.1 glycosyltransferase family 4 protein [Candidatus Woesebacteria bacterium]
MKILMLTPYLPYPPASGGQIRTYNLLRHLSSAHEITLVCLYKKIEERQYAQHLKDYCKDIYLCKRPEKPWQISTVLKSVFGLLPFLVVRNYSQEAADKVEELLKTESFDVLHAETFYVMPHIPKTHIPTLLVDQTLEYRVYKHYITQLPWYLHHPLRLDTFKLKFWEKHYWNHAQLVAAVSDSDAAMIHDLAPNINPVVIPNGASDDMFVMDPVKKDIKESVKMLFVGNFSWLQNTEAVGFLIEQVMPLLSHDTIQYELTVAGQNIPSRLLQAKASNLHFVNLNEAGNEQVRQVYTDAHVFVAPIFGPGGTRLKILTAMATRLPVVTTATGAEGLALQDGVSVLLAQSPQEFAQKITHIAQDDVLRQALAHNAYTIARSQFSWESITKKLVSSYESLVSSRN